MAMARLGFVLAPRAEDTGGPRAQYRVAKIRTDVTYSPNGSKLDVYRPLGQAPEEGWPAIIAIPGGGFRWASKADYGSRAAVMGKYGYAVVAIEYAFSTGTSRSWPASIQDVRRSVQWVRRFADVLNVDPNRIVAMGESAGGNLAALAGVLPEAPVDWDGNGVDAAAMDEARASKYSTRVQAAVDFYGPSDLAHEFTTRPRARPYLAPYLGGTPSQVPGRYAAASPITHVTSDDAPLFLAQGKRDAIVPYVESIWLHQAYQTAGVPSELVLMDQPHGFSLRGKRFNLIPRILAFLDEVWARTDDSSE
jgi:acetyl esterase/lipase